MLMLIPLASASTLVVDSVSGFPPSINPGERITLEVKVGNEGDEDIKNVRVSLDLAELPFAPLASSEKLVDELEEDDSAILSFNLKSFPDTKPGIYKIPITVSSEDSKTTSFTSITVNSNPLLQVGIEESTIITPLEKGRIVVRFVNTGDGDIKFLTAKIPRLPLYEILTQNTFYIGNIEPDDFETIEAELLLKQNINSIPLEVSYKDSFNNEFTQTFHLDIKTYSREEALALGLIHKSNTGFVVITIILVLILFFVYRRYKKR